MLPHWFMPLPYHVAYVRVHSFTLNWFEKRNVHWHRFDREPCTVVLWQDSLNIGRARQLLNKIWPRSELCDWIQFSFWMQATKRVHSHMQLVQLVLPIALLEDAVKVAYYRVAVIHISRVYRSHHGNMLTLIATILFSQLSVEKPMRMRCWHTTGRCSISSRRRIFCELNHA